MVGDSEISRSEFLPVKSLHIHWPNNAPLAGDVAPAFRRPTIVVVGLSGKTVDK
jgi:hypothetical protein